MTIDLDAIDLDAIAAERGIKYFLISFTDLMGVQRAKLVPRTAIKDMARTGAAFAGFATWLDMTPADPDMFAIPDPQSLIQLPWKPEVGWLAASSRRMRPRSPTPPTGRPSPVTIRQPSCGATT
jgi:glutamine synthetase